MKSKVPRVGIGLPVYNAQDFVSQAIESILSQSFTDFELVISDNASTDETEVICRRFADLDERIRYFRQRENYGPVHNFNSVFRLSRGEYFKWAAADDVCAPDFLLRCVEALERDPSVVLAHTRCVGIDEDGHPTSVNLIPGPGRARTGYEYSNVEGPISASSLNPVHRFRRLMQDLWYTVQLYGVIRSETLAKTPLHPHHYMGDHILLAELSLHGRFCEVPEELFFRRVHSLQTSVAGARRRAQLSATNSNSPRVSAWKMMSIYPARLNLHIKSIARAPLSWRRRLKCYLIVGESIMRWFRHRASQALSRILRRRSS